LPLSCSRIATPAGCGNLRGPAISNFGTIIIITSEYLNGMHIVLANLRACA
jgi:hypothetical protein